MSGGTGVFVFGRFRLDTRRRVLLRDDSVVPLTPKAFDVLRVLVAAHGRVVEKGEILEAVWPDTTVEDGNLTVNVSIVRRALGESRTEHPFIVTIPGRGYQFVSEVRALTTEMESSSPAAVEVQAPRTTAVTKVPPPVPVDPWWKRITGSWRTLVPGLTLIAAMALPVGWLNTGGRGSAPVIEDLEARALYLRGRLLLSRRTEESLTMGQRYFERAVERAPDYARAYAGLADALSMQAYFGVVSPLQAHEPARAAARRALELDPTSAEAHTSLAYILHRFEWNFAAAEQSFKRAIELEPTYALAYHWYAALLDSVGRRSDAIAYARRAEILDPLTPVISVNLNGMLRPDSAGDFFERGMRPMEMDPGLWLSHWSAAGVYRSRGQLALALEEYRRAAELAGRGTYVLTRLGVVYANAGRIADAVSVLRELEALGRQRYVSPYARVPILAALGQHDQAFTWLGRAFDERSSQLPFIAINLAELRPDTRFTTYLTRVGLR